jgi:FkbM family methyltransferase
LLRHESVGSVIEIRPGVWGIDDDTHITPWSRSTWPRPECIGLLDYVPHGTRVIDAGAGIGDNAVVFASRASFVEAFEPHPLSYEALSKNIAPLKNCTGHNACLGDRPGKATADSLDVKNYGDTKFSHDDLGVTVITALDVFGFDDIGLIKIDVEGMEWFVLSGARETIDRCRPVMIVELGPHGSRFGIDGVKVGSLIESMGYTIRSLKSSNAWMLEDIQNVHVDVLCRPK